MATGKLEHRIENGNVLVLERVFGAPRELVFRTFGDSEHLKHWWGPRGWELTYSRIDFRPGGSWHYCMTCVDESQGEWYGRESWGKMLYREIEEPSRIVNTDYFSDAEGNISDSLPASDTVWEFIDQGRTTKLVSRTVYADAAALETVLDMGMLQGIGETYDRLDEYVVSLA